MENSLLVGKKYMNSLGSMGNDTAGFAMSDFAQRQMAKMGWEAGKGLGKAEQGITTNVKVKRNMENHGVGVARVESEEKKSTWWCNVYDNMASKIQVQIDGSSSKKSKKKKKSKDSQEPYVPPTDEELFKATGGKLFGRRAYGSCNGKLKRDQEQVRQDLESRGKDTKKRQKTSDKKKKKSKSKKSSS